MNCRFCKTELANVFIDLVNSPASNSFLSFEQLSEPEVFYPLKVFVCHHCFLVQVDEYKKSDSIFDNTYAYFSSYSSSWLKHAQEYVKMISAKLHLNSSSRVIEVASNDGYMLQYFKEANIPTLGIEPTSNTAQIAINKGIETVVDFFGVRLAKDLAAKGVKADLLLGNNVLAHVPDIMDFVGGMKFILNSGGVITMEFPHLMELVENNQFDTIYHEHFSYLSLHVVKAIFEANELELFDVERLSTHGGSLRIYAKRKSDPPRLVSGALLDLLQLEKQKGLLSLNYYSQFSAKAIKVKYDVTSFLISKAAGGMKIAAYGAAAKGNTLLNYCGIKNDTVSFVVDANPHKQNKFLPASHIPVVAEAELVKFKPDFVLILPWNLKEEVMQQLAYIRQWGGKFVIPIPHLQII